MRFGPLPERLTGRGRPDLPVARGERLLAWADGPDGPVGGSRAALYVPHRVPWEAVAKADWDTDEETLRVVEIAPWGKQQPVHVRRLADAERLLDLVRERVTASIVVQRRAAVSPGREVRVVGRRAPGGHDPITWWVDYDDGIDPADPVVRRVVGEALASAQADVGE